MNISLRRAALGGVHSMSSLYQNLGGQVAVDTVVDTFYRGVLADARIAHFFHGIDMDRQISKQKAFLTMVFGGPAHYTGKNMRDGHRHLVRRGLNDSHVDAVIECLATAMRTHGIGDAEIEQVAAIANSVRDDVLNRPHR